MAAETSIKLTYEDYLAIPDDGRRHEIIDGEYFVNPAPNLKHQTALLNLAYALRQHVRQHRLGEVVAAAFDVILDELDVVQPDVLFVSQARAHLLTPDNMRSAPDLVVEILSTNRNYDERVKFRLYERAGVLEYWIIDPYTESARVFRRSGNKFDSVPVDEALSSPLLPGFELRIKSLFT